MMVPNELLDAVEDEGEAHAGEYQTENYHDDNYPVLRKG